MSSVVNNRLCILIIDDDEDDFFIASELLKQIEGYELQTDWCYRYSDAVDHLKHSRYDIYFVDYRLGAKTGLDFLKEAVVLGVEDPIVLLTGKGNREIDIKAMQTGATDYLIKTELTVDKMERCIRYALERTSYLKALRENEKKYRSIFELSKDAVFITNASLHFKDFNQAASDLLGYPKTDLLRLSVYDVLDDAVQKIFLQKLLFDEGEVNDLELDFQTKKGEKKCCILTISTMPGVKDQTVYQCLIHDITNLKKAEKANLLVEKLAATGRLVRTLAHEVRNPLNNINMSVEQLGHEIQEGEERLYLDIIQRNSKRISDLITELLDSSRPSDLTFERTSLQTVMDESIAEAMDSITLQRIDMQIGYCDAPCWIMANRDKLKLAFLNIIINAIEAMQTNGGKLNIEIETINIIHKVTIKDNGCGIPEENLSRLFEPYFTSKRNGMGLGLAATLNILQSHKAHIDVSSEVNEGTTFIITFPTA